MSANLVTDNQKKKPWWLIPTTLIPVILLIVLIVAAICATIIICINTIFKKEEKTPPKPEVISTSQLYEVLNVSDLSTYECIYNGVCTVYKDDKKKKVAYYCSYEATVRAGISFQDIKIELIDKDDTTKIISVTIPDVIINEPNVKRESLDYIFVDNSYNKTGIGDKAHPKCVEDAKKKSQAEAQIAHLARQNAENIVKGLIEPFVEDVNTGDVTYILEIKKMEVAE